MQTARQSLDLLRTVYGSGHRSDRSGGRYGGYVIQLAKAEGLTVIADASEKDEKLSFSSLAWRRYRRSKGR